MTALALGEGQGQGEAGRKVTREELERFKE